MFYSFGVLNQIKVYRVLKGGGFIALGSSGRTQSRALIPSSLFILYMYMHMYMYMYMYMHMYMYMYMYMYIHTYIYICIVFVRFISFFFGGGG